MLKAIARQFRLPKRKKAVFACQITDDALKVAKCLFSSGAKCEFAALEIERLSAGADNKKIAQRLGEVLKKLDGAGSPLILSLPRSSAVLRYLKVPSSDPHEIEKIVNLQSQHYLPYPAGELVAGFQVVSADKEGYSDINIAVVHRDVIKRYSDIFKEAKIPQFKIILSSYGLANLYCHLKGGEGGPVMLADIDSQQAEVAVVLGSRLLFSRSFKFLRLDLRWPEAFIVEVSKTLDAYLKETSRERPQKMVVFGPRDAFEKLAGPLKSQVKLPAEFSDYLREINLAKDLSIPPDSLENSFASLAGLGLEEAPESLNLIPQEIKEAVRKAGRRREYLRLGLLLAGAALVFGLGVSKNLNNKAQYLAKYRAELQKIAREAKPLEDMERRLKFIEARSGKRLFILDALCELSRAMSPRLSLADLAYEEGGQIILRGEAQDLASVFEYVSGLEQSAAIKDFAVKVRYATKKRTQSGEIVDFEIDCLKK